jgi:hypothetical protein
MMDTAQTLSSVYFRVNFLLNASVRTNLIDERWGGVKQLLLLSSFSSRSLAFIPCSSSSFIFGLGSFSRSQAELQPVYWTSLDL